MAEILTADLKCTLSVKFSNTVSLSGGKPIRADFDIDFSQVFSNGAGAALGEINEVFSDTRTLAASAVENLDLAGVLANAFRSAITFNRVKLILAKLRSAVTNQASSILIGGVAAAGFITPFGDATDKLRIRKGGGVLLMTGDTTGFAVTATTGDLLKVANEDGVNAAVYDIVLLGTKP